MENTLAEQSPSANPVVEEKRKRVSLSGEGEFRFRIAFEGVGESLIVDEPAPLGAGAGPEASQLLAAAIGQCLSASLTLCLRKSRIESGALRTDVVLTIARNDAGRLRVARADVTLSLDAEAGSKLERCLGMFEEYCTVTASIRRAFPVRVTVTGAGGAVVHVTEG